MKKLVWVVQVYILFGPLAFRHFDLLGALSSDQTVQCMSMWSLLCRAELEHWPITGFVWASPGNVGEEETGHIGELDAVGRACFDTIDADPVRCSLFEWRARESTREGQNLHGSFQTDPIHCGRSKQCSAWWAHPWRRTCQMAHMIRRYDHERDNKGTICLFGFSQPAHPLVHVELLVGPALFGGLPDWGGV